MVGNVTLIDDPDEQARLDDLLIAQLRADTLPFLLLAPPEVVAWESVVGFRIPDRHTREQDPSLNLELQMLDGLKPRADWNIEWLKSKRIVAMNPNGTIEQSWSAYDCLIAEFDDGGARYALFAGDWFKIDPSFVNRINTAIAAIPTHTGYAFPHALLTDKEDTFNSRVANTSNGRILLLDKRTIRHGPGGSRIEVCDLLDLHDRTLYHIKDKFRSSGLSHLFTQAAVSAELLCEDEDFRLKVRRAHAPAAGLFPDAAPDTRNYGVVLGIISTRATAATSQMPFLSKVRLDNLRKQLARLGYGRLEIMTIPRQ